MVSDEILHLDSGLNDTNTDVKFNESDSELFLVLARIREKPQISKFAKIDFTHNKYHHPINRLKVHVFHHF